LCWATAIACWFSFVKTEEANPNLNPCVGAGATAIACWLEDSIHENALKIYAACAGDSQAIVFNKFSARIPTRKCRLWDDEMQVSSSSYDMHVSSSSYDMRACDRLWTDEMQVMCC